MKFVQLLKKHKISAQPILEILEHHAKIIIPHAFSNSTYGRSVQTLRILRLCPQQSMSRAAKMIDALIQFAEQNEDIVAILKNHKLQISDLATTRFVLRALKEFDEYTRKYAASLQTTGLRRPIDSARDSPQLNNLLFDLANYVDCQINPKRRLLSSFKDPKKQERSHDQIKMFLDRSYEIAAAVVNEFFEFSRPLGLANVRSRVHRVNDKKSRQQKEKTDTRTITKTSQLS